MNYTIDINQDPQRSLTISRENKSSKNLPPVFYGDKWIGRFYVYDNGDIPTWLANSRMFIGLGEIGNDPLVVVEATYIDNYFEVELDFQTDTFELLTRGLESVQRTLEVQISRPNAESYTILQQSIEVRNQILAQLDVTLSPPVEPYIFPAVIRYGPDNPQEVFADATPLRPSLIIVSATGTNTENQVPFAPIDPQAEVFQAPLAPDNVDAIISPFPQHVEWVFAGLLANLPDQINASVISALEPDLVTAENLSTEMPLTALALSVETIPLEVDQCEVTGTPLRPDEVEIQISPLEVDNLIAYNYNSRPAGFYGGEPSELETIEVFAPDAPSNVRAAEGANPEPSEVEAYIHVTSGSLSSPVRVVPSNIESDISPIAPTMNEKYSIDGENFYIGTNLADPNLDLAFDYSHNLNDYNAWSSIEHPHAEKIRKNIVDFGTKLRIANDAGVSLRLDAYPTSYLGAHNLVGRFTAGLNKPSTRYTTNSTKYGLTTGGGEQLSYMWDGPFSPVRDALVSGGLNTVGWYHTEQDLYSAYLSIYDTGGVHYTSNDNANGDFSNDIGFSAFIGSETKNSTKWAQFIARARGFYDSIGVINPNLNAIGNYNSQLNDSNAMMWITSWLGIPRFPAENDVTIEDIAQPEDNIFKVKLTPKFSRHDTFAPRGVFNNLTTEYNSIYGKVFINGNPYYQDVYTKAKIKTSGSWLVQFANLSGQILQQTEYFNWDYNTGLPEEVEFADPNGLVADICQCRVIQNPYEYLSNSSAHPLLGIRMATNWVTIYRNQVAPSEPIELRSGEFYTPENLPDEKKPIWWFDASDEDCFTFGENQPYAEFEYADILKLPIKYINAYKDKRGSSYPVGLAERIGSDNFVTPNYTKLNDSNQLDAYRYYDTQLKAWGVQDMGCSLPHQFNSNDYDIFLIATRRYAPDRAYVEPMHLGGSQMYHLRGGGQYIGLGQAGYPNNENTWGLYGVEEKVYSDNATVGMEYFTENEYGTGDYRRLINGNGIIIPPGSPLQRLHWDEKYQGIFHEQATITADEWEYNHGLNTRFAYIDTGLNPFTYPKYRGISKNVMHLYHWIAETNNHFEYSIPLLKLNNGSMTEASFANDIVNNIKSISRFSGGYNSDFYAGNSIIGGDLSFDNIPIVNGANNADIAPISQKKLAEAMYKRTYWNSDWGMHQALENYGADRYYLDTIDIGNPRPQFDSPPDSQDPVDYYKKYFEKKNMFIHEIVICPKLTYSERKNIQGYLAHKWGIANKLWGDYRAPKYQKHQFKDLAPTTDTALQDEYPEFMTDLIHSGFTDQPKLDRNGEEIKPWVNNLDTGTPLTSNGVAGIIMPKIVFDAGTTKIERYLSIHSPKPDWEEFRWSTYTGTRTRADGTQIVGGQAWMARYTWNVMREMYFKNCPDIPYASLVTYNTSGLEPIWLYQEENPNRDANNIPSGVDITKIARLQDTKIFNY